MNEIPKGDWRCPNCIAEICKKPTDSYGFEQSKKKYSLNEFSLMANKFKENHFKKRKESITSDEIEREFWRILASPNESIAVEYGADLHTLDIGSGFPTISYKEESKSNDKVNYFINIFFLNYHLTILIALKVLFGLTLEFKQFTKTWKINFKPNKC